MTAAADWQARVGDVWAAEWRRTDRSFAGLSRELDASIAAVAPEYGRVADIGCGAGGTALALADARPGVDVVGIDLSPALVAVAKERAARRTNVRFVAGAVPEALTPFAPLDLIVSRHGVMFFADPAAAFVRIAAAMAPGGSLVFSCFRAVADNPWATDVARAVGADAPPATGYAPGPFAFADPAFVAGLLAAAGFVDAAPRAVDWAYRAGEGADAAGDALAFFRRIGPAARALAALPENDRPTAETRLHRLLADRVTDGAVDFPAAAWIWTATRAGEPA